jgi:hypothetical protein
MTVSNDTRKRILERGAERAYTRLPSKQAVAVEAPPAQSIAVELPPLPSERQTGQRAERSMRDILIAHGLEDEGPRMLPQPQVRPLWPIITAGVFGTFLVFGLVLFLLSRTAPQTSVQQTVVPVTTVAPTADAPNSRTPLAARYPIQAAAQPDTSADAQAIDDTVVYRGATLTRAGEELTVTIGASESCIPIWWSPGPSWGGWETAKIKFVSERAGCVAKTDPLSIVGWYGQTDWVYLAHCKVADCNVNDAKAIDMVWSDITAFGYTMSDVHALPGAEKMKDYALLPTATVAPATPVTYTPPPPVQQDAPAQSYQAPVPAPVATPAPPEPTDKPLLPASQPAFADDVESEKGTVSAPSKPDRDDAVAPAATPDDSWVDKFSHIPTAQTTICVECHH